MARPRTYNGIIKGKPFAHDSRLKKILTDAVAFGGAQSVVAVLDDDESARKALVRLLEAAGHTARGFSSGRDFLESWHLDAPDCLVLDLQMPGLAGVDVQQGAQTRPVRNFPLS